MFKRASNHKPFQVVSLKTTKFIVSFCLGLFSLLILSSIVQAEVIQENEPEQNQVEPNTGSIDVDPIDTAPVEPNTDSIDVNPINTDLPMDTDTVPMDTTNDDATINQFLDKIKGTWKGTINGSNQAVIYIFGINQKLFLINSSPFGDIARETRYTIEKNGETITIEIKFSQTKVVKTIIKYEQEKNELWIESAPLNNTDNVPTEFTDNKIVFTKNSDEIEPSNMPIVPYEEA